MLADEIISTNFIEIAIFTVGFADLINEIKFIIIGLYSFLNDVFVHMSIKCKLTVYTAWHRSWYESRDCLDSVRNNNEKQLK